MFEWLDVIIEPEPAHTNYTIHHTFLLNVCLICLPQLLSNVLGNIKTCKLIDSTSKNCDLNLKIALKVKNKSTGKNNFVPSNEFQIFSLQIPTTFHLRTWREIYIYLGFSFVLGKEEKERQKQQGKQKQRDRDRERILISKHLFFIDFHGHPTPYGQDSKISRTAKDLNDHSPRSVSNYVPEIPRILWQPLRAILGIKGKPDHGFHQNHSTIICFTYWGSK